MLSPLVESESSLLRLGKHVMSKLSRIQRQCQHLNTSKTAVALVITLAGCMVIKSLRDTSLTLYEKDGRRNKIRKRGSTAGGGDSQELDIEEMLDIHLVRLGEEGRISTFERLYGLLKDQACCDVTLKVGTISFKAHKCVLAAASMPLRAMFDSGFKEGNESVIVLHDVDERSFEQFLEFVYDRSVEVNRYNLEKLLDLSARYQIPQLRKHCCSFLAASADHDNACALLTIADRYNCVRLRTGLRSFVLASFEQSCGADKDGFLDLPQELLVDLLADDNLCAAEAVVFRESCHWLEHKKDRRKEADVVLAHVRFSLIGATAIAEEIEHHDFMQSESGKRAIHSAYRYLALPPTQRNKCDMGNSARPRHHPPLGARDSRMSSSGSFMVSFNNDSACNENTVTPPAVTSPSASVSWPTPSAVAGEESLIEEMEAEKVLENSIVRDTVGDVDTKLRATSILSEHGTDMRCGPSNTVSTTAYV